MHFTFIFSLLLELAVLSAAAPAMLRTGPASAPAERKQEQDPQEVVQPASELQPVDGFDDIPFWYATATGLGLGLELVHGSPAVRNYLLSPVKQLHDAIRKPRQSASRAKTLIRYSGDLRSDMSVYLREIRKARYSQGRVWQPKSIRGKLSFDITGVPELGHRKSKYQDCMMIRNKPMTRLRRDMPLDEWRAMTRCILWALGLIGDTVEDIVDPRPDYVEEAEAVDNGEKQVKQKGQDNFRLERPTLGRSQPALTPAAFSAAAPKALSKPPNPKDIALPVLGAIGTAGTVALAGANKLVSGHWTEPLLGP